MKYTINHGVEKGWLHAAIVVLLTMSAIAMASVAYESVSESLQSLETSRVVQSTDLEVKDAHTSSQSLQPAARAYYAQPSISGEYLQYGDGSRWIY